MPGNRLRTLRAHLIGKIRGYTFLRMQTEPHRYAMDHLYLYSYLFRRSQTLFARLSTHELHVWLDTLYATRTKLADQADIVFGGTTSEKHHKTNKNFDCEFAGAPVPENLRSLGPSAERQFPASGIMKAPCSGHLDESAVCSTHNPRVSWGGHRYHDIDKIGRWPYPNEKSHAGYHECRKKRFLLQQVLNKDANFYQEQLSSVSCFAAGLSKHEAEDLFLKMTRRLPPVENVIKDILRKRSDLEFYEISCVLLSSRRLDFRMRLFIHEYLALTEYNEEVAAYHADIALELVMTATEIPLGPLSGRDSVVDSAMKADLSKELEDARNILQLVNQGQRVHVHWNRLAEGSEMRRMYMQKPEYQDVASRDASDQEISSDSVVTLNQSTPEDTPSKARKLPNQAQNSKTSAAGWTLCAEVPSQAYV